MAGGAFCAAASFSRHARSRPPPAATLAHGPSPLVSASHAANSRASSVMSRASSLCSRCTCRLQPSPSRPAARSLRRHEVTSSGGSGGVALGKAFWQKATKGSLCTVSRHSAIRALSSVGLMARAARCAASASRQPELKRGSSSGELATAPALEAITARQAVSTLTACSGRQGD